MKNRYRNLGLFSMSLALSLIFAGKSYAGWKIQSVDTADDVGKVSSIAVDSKNNSHIAYYDETNLKLKYAKWTGSEWSISTVDSMGSIQYTFYLNIDIKVDSADNPHISYYNGLNKDLKYAKWTGISWAISTVDSSGDVGQYSSMELDSLGNPHISYYDATYGKWNLKYAKWTGVSWSITTVGSDYVSTYNSITLDSTDNPHIAYFDSGTGLMYAKWTDSSWAISTVDTGGSVGEYPSIALDSAGNPNISYCDNTNKKLKYAKWSGSSWSIETIDSLFRKTALAIDSSDNVHIVYRDANFKLKYAKGTAGSWSIKIVDLYTGFYPAIALDSTGNPHISYYLSSDLKYAQWANGAELTWTGEPNYESDGLNPEIGDSSTQFNFRVNYTHPGNKAPKSGYPKLIIKTTYGYTLQTISMNYVSGNYNTGAVYAISTTLPLYSYVCFVYSFEAYDLDDFAATDSISGNGPARAYLSGYVESPNGNSLKDVLVTLSGSESGTTRTGSSGYYQFNPSLGGNYTVTPSAGNTSFNPASRTYTNLNSVQFSQDFIRVVSNPTLSWTEETNYQSTGLNPEIGNSLTIFTYRVKYTDSDNDPPQAGFPKVVIKEPSVLKTLSMNYVSGSYNTGAIYTISTTLPFDGEKDYSYQFEAYDIWDDSATSFIGGAGPQGTYLSGYLRNPDNSGIRNILVRLSGGETRERTANSAGYYCFDVNLGQSYTVTPVGTNYTFSPPSRTYTDITGSIPNQDFVRAAGNPVLSWTGETNYESGGVNIKKGYQSTIFVFRVKYTDAENDYPEYPYPLLHLYKDGEEISGSPFSMDSADGDDTKYDDGKIYAYSTNLDAGTNYAYSMEACDRWEAKAAGEATALKDGLFVSALQLPIVGQAKVVGPAASRGLINPGKGDKAQIYFQGTKIGDFSCRVYNVDGELIFEAAQSNVNDGFFEWQPTDIASGVYLAHIQGPGVNFKRKMVLLR